ncbi:MAG: NAD-binding protein, partial [Gemmataceae bacterium]
MNVLIVGCGYLGQRVAQALLRESARVMATTRRPENAERLRQMGVHPFLADVLDPDSLRALPEVDAVVYSVGLDRKAGHSMREVYVNGPENVLRALPGSPRVVHISSTSV